MIRLINLPKNRLNKTPSIRRFLFISLLLATTLTTTVMLTWTYLGLKKQTEQLFETQLIEAVKTLQAILGKNIRAKDLSALQSALDEISKPLHTLSNGKPEYPIGDEYRHQYESRIVFQVWDSAEEKLLLRSSFAPQEHSISNQDWTESGFASQEAGQHTWFSFAQYDPEQKIQVVASQREDIREELVHQITEEYLLPLLLVYPFLGLLIWFTIERAFRLLAQVSEELYQRQPGHLEPLTLKGVPSEILPLTEAINHLFERLKDAFEKEVRFNADAAHELKTPLAGIRTQAQVALREEDLVERNQILKKLIQGVDRATHIVQQLLILSKYDFDSPQSSFKSVELSVVINEVQAEMESAANKKNIELNFNCDQKKICLLGDNISLRILIRNLIDNAIRYSPDDSKITMSLTLNKKSEVVFRIIDGGPGIPEADRQRVFERFYRRLGNQASGSGLGLSIVNQIANLHNATVTLHTPATGIGLEVRVHFSNPQDTPSD